jgi:large subunit ribosomal protein L9
MGISIISLEERKGTPLGETKVRRGYARYLVKHKKALRYDKSDKTEVEKFEQMRASLVQEAAERVKQAQQKGEQLQALSIKLSSRAADDVRLYGSLGVKEVTEAIIRAGVSIDKKDVRLPSGPIRQVGNHEVVVHLHDTVVVKLTIQVIPAGTLAIPTYV